MSESKSNKRLTMEMNLRVGMIIKNPTEEDISKMFSEWKNITVSHSSEGLNRNGFHPQICVCGELEHHPDQGTYRVLMNDSAYTYFSIDDVVAISESSETGTRVIHVNIKGKE